MPSRMKFLLNGYSGYATIGGHDMLMTSFSVSMNENVLPSQGAAKLVEQLSDGGVEFRRLDLNAVRDYHGYDISITVDATYDILVYMLGRITGRFNSFVPVEFHDNASKIHYSFENCCMTSVSLSVSLNSAASLSMSFTAFDDEFVIEYMDGGYNVRAGRNAPSQFVGNVLLPYWAFGVQALDASGNGYRLPDGLKDVSLNWQCAVTPKFGCHGVPNTNAPAPSKVVFAKPSVNYELSYVVADEKHWYNHQYDSDEVAISGMTVLLRFYEQTVIDNMHTLTRSVDVAMTDCYHEKFTPQYANKDEVNTIGISGVMHGKMTYDASSVTELTIG